MFAEVKTELELPKEIYKQYLAAASKRMARDMAGCAGWFLVRVQTGREISQAQRMERAGLDVWLPNTTETRIFEERRGRKRKGRPRRRLTVEEPVLVFDGHVLVNFVPSAQAWHGISGILGVIGIYCNVNSLFHDDFNRRLESALSPRVVARLRQLEGEVHGFNETVFKPNDKIRVIDGPFEGHIGTVSHKKTPFGLVCAEVHLLGRATPVVLDIEQVEAA